MRYRVVQHFGKGYKLIFATLEVEGGDYQTPEKIKKETSTIQTGNWIEATPETIPGYLLGAAWHHAAQSRISAEDVERYANEMTALEHPDLMYPR